MRSYEARPAAGEGGAGRNDPRVATGLPRMVAFGEQMNDQGCRDRCRCCGANCARNHRDAEATMDVLTKALVQPKRLKKPKQAAQDSGPAESPGSMCC